MSSSSDDETRSAAEAGELNFFRPEVAAHPQPIFDRIRRECPVGKPIPEGGICLSRYEDVSFALKHPEIFSSAMPAGLIGNKRPLIPLHIDPPDQVKYRKLLDPLFSRKKMLQLEDQVRPLAAGLAEKFAEAGECEFNRDFAIPYPCTVFLRIMGLPLEDLELFLEIKDGIIRPETVSADPAAAAAIRVQAGERTYSYFERMLAERRNSLGDDLLSLFLQAEVDGQKMSDEELLDICFLFLIAGLDTVTATLGCTVSYLAQHPEQRQSLVDDPSRIPGAVEELLRWETPVVQVVRILTRDHTIGGVDLAAGEAVTLVLGSADTDEDHFPNANEVQFDRTPNKHLAFGGGAHRCLGSHLARMELRVALEELHRLVPVYAIKAGETPVYTHAIREVTYLPLEWEVAGAR